MNQTYVNQVHKLFVYICLFWFINFFSLSIFFWITYFQNLPLREPVNHGSHIKHPLIIFCEYVGWKKAKRRKLIRRCFGNGQGEVHSYIPMSCLFVFKQKYPTSEDPIVWTEMISISTKNFFFRNFPPKGI